MNYENPLIGAEEMPQFGWEIESSKRDVVQKSYQLQISENEKFEELVYDSGVVWSEESAHIRPQDVKLQSARKYFVRVKIQDQVETSLWSEPAYFLTALLNETWRAPFVSADTEEADKQSSKGTYVRGCFEVKKPVREAIAFATGLGLYQFFLNGEKVGEDEMTPGWTSYRKHLLYQTYDVKNLLKEGTNVAGAMLGPGWYKGAMGLTKSRNNYGDQTGFAIVDGFQGQERDVILISLVRANEDGKIGFLNDLRRMNVAITRARMKLMILGDASTLTRHAFYKELYNYISQRGKIITINTKQEHEL